MKNNLKFEDFPNINTWINVIYFNGKQIGTIKQNDSGKFYCNFNDGYNFLYLVLKDNNEHISFNLIELQNNIEEVFNDIKNSILC